ncbi:MAG TPA: hypothetical protein VFE35_06890 [Candidatus Cybelea sp.]|jgi:hypothetical protein|nr:hypothetical protein [Candidatus Cybelea sp.]
MKAALILCAIAASSFWSPSPAYAGGSAVHHVDGVITHVGRGNQGTEFYIRSSGVPERFWFDNASNFAINGHHPNCQGMAGFGDFTKGTMPGCPGWAPVTIGKTRVRVSYREVQSEGSTLLIASSLQTI